MIRRTTTVGATAGSSGRIREFVNSCDGRGGGGKEVERIAGSFDSGEEKDAKNKETKRNFEGTKRPFYRLVGPDSRGKMVGECEGTNQGNIGYAKPTWGRAEDCLARHARNSLPVCGAILGRIHIR